MNPDAFVFQVSILLVTMCLVGGLGQLSGPVVGAIIFTILPEILRPFAEYKEFFSGIVLLGFLILMPRGLAALTEKPRVQKMGTGPARYEEGDVIPEPVVTRDVILSVIKVSLAFGGNRVLHDVSLDVDRGQLYAIIGPNGAGKTSLFNVLTRLYDADSGQAALDDANLFDLTATDLARCGVMRTFQNILISEGAVGSR